MLITHETFFRERKKAEKISRDALRAIRRDKSYVIASFDSLLLNYYFKNLLA